MTAIKKRGSNLERVLAYQIEAYGLPEPVTEHAFAAAYVGRGPGIKKRLKDAGLKNWRLDFAWPDYMLAVEVEGITPAGGRHQRIGGFKGDLDKYHHAMAIGWTVYRTSGHLINNGESIRLIEKLIQLRDK